MAKKKVQSKTLSKSKPKKIGPIDGFGSYEKRKIRNAVRQIWQRSKARRIAKERCRNEEGYYVCEQCTKQQPEITVDHIIAIGDMDEVGFLERLMVDSTGLKCLCDDCHKVKTKEDVRKINEGKELRAKTKATVTRLGLGGEVQLKTEPLHFNTVTVDDLI